MLPEFRRTAPRLRGWSRWVSLIALGWCSVHAAAQSPGIRPVGANGQPLNLDFETGDLRDWTSDGNAFEGQPIRGDTVKTRRPDMASNHTGNFWIGTYERAGDPPKGTLTSAPFKVTQPWASFRMAGGTSTQTRVEIGQTAQHLAGIVWALAAPRGLDPRTGKPVSSALVANRVSYKYFSAPIRALIARFETAVG